MNEILHANIFFIIASIATVIFCILTCIILYHVIKIVRSLRSIIERIESASEVVAEDVAHVRALIASNTLFSRLLNFMGASNFKRKTTKKKKTVAD
jgi:uncharacterized protein YacL